MAPVISILAILIASFYAVILNFSFYKVIFINKVKPIKSGKRYYLMIFLSGLVKAYVLAHILKFTFSDTPNEAIEVSFWVWLGFILTTLYTNSLMKKEYLKNEIYTKFYFLLEIAGMGTILSFWN